MENIYILVVVIILLEVFDVQWQKADSMMGMLLRFLNSY